MDNYIKRIVQKCEIPLMNLKSKKVFVAGYGFYGKWIVDVLTYCGIDVRFGSRTFNKWDILRKDTYSGFEKEADFIINCAGRSDIFSNSAAIGNGPEVLCGYKKRTATFLQISSGIVGRKSIGQYSSDKRSAESSLLEFDNVQIVRPFASVGPQMGLDKSFAISTFIHNKLLNKPLEVASGVKRSFCHVSDLIPQILLVLVFGDGEPYEVGSDDIIDLEDAAKIISSDVKVVNKKFQSNAGKTYSANLERMKDQFGYELDYSSLAAVKDTLDFYVKKKPYLSDIGAIL